MKISELVLWLKNKVKQAGAKGIVFGLSGGVDSAVVAALVKKAVGNNHLALLLPCHSSGHSLDDASLMVKRFKLKSKIIDLTATFDQMIKIMPKGNDLARANLKPRLRMMTLYYFANNLNYLVCGTGNYSECMIGYFTKYGDGGVDILPIADMLKRDVRKLAKELNIPDKIIQKTPTADLWHGQTDEQEMGLSYDELDCILSCIEQGKKCAVPRAKINKVKKMIKASEHKRVFPEIYRINQKLKTKS
ncbi:MAG: NAD(+) synthase [Candidatus Omnitrophica bacterium]|nr:NAD(+) synthase [Candidatus Omnitrophota bacterium]